MDDSIEALLSLIEAVEREDKEKRADLFHTFIRLFAEFEVDWHSNIKKSVDEIEQILQSNDLFRFRNDIVHVVSKLCYSDGNFREKAEKLAKEENIQRLKDGLKEMKR